MTALQYLKKTEAQRLADLTKFLSFPSVSAQPHHKKDIRTCAEWLAAHLKKVGFKSRLYPTKGNPIVFSEYKAGKGKPTILYYGHYDVQPPEPLELWKSQPFKPQIRNGYLYGRGSSDDKGQVFAHIKGLEAVLKSEGTLPINVKFLIEGEEETHSVNLPAFIRKNKKMLAADVVVVSDSSQYSKTLPSVTFGLRGIAAAEVTVYGPNRDLHSGSYGGAIANPINVLCDLVAQLRDKNGKVTIPGFYSKVQRVTPWLKKQYKKLPFNEKAYKSAIGVPALDGEKGFSTFERTWDRPTLDINGITGGYQGEGAKTIIPSWASCKVTMRLVPDQEPGDILKKLDRYLKKIAPKSVRLKVDLWGGAKGVVVPSDGPWLEAAARAIRKGFGKQPVFTKEGGSIPVVVDFKEMLGLDTLLIGFGQADDNVHSPNERFRIKDFERGCKTAAVLPDELAEVED